MTATLDHAQQCGCYFFTLFVMTINRSLFIFILGGTNHGDDMATDVPTDTSLHSPVLLRQNEADLWLSSSTMMPPFSPFCFL